MESNGAEAQFLRGIGSRAQWCARWPPWGKHSRLPISLLPLSSSRWWTSWPFGIGPLSASHTARCKRSVRFGLMLLSVRS